MHVLYIHCKYNQYIYITYRTKNVTSGSVTYSRLIWEIDLPLWSITHTSAGSALLCTKQTSTPCPPCPQWGSLFQLKPLSQSCPQATLRPPASCGAHRGWRCEESPRRSDWVGVRGEEDEKGRNRSKWPQEAALTQHHEMRSNPLNWK